MAVGLRVFIWSSARSNQRRATSGAKMQREKTSNATAAEKWEFLSFSLNNVLQLLFWLVNGAVFIGPSSLFSQKGSYWGEKRLLFPSAGPTGRPPSCPNTTTEWSSRFATSSPSMRRWPRSDREPLGEEHDQLLIVGFRKWLESASELGLPNPKAQFQWGCCCFFLVSKKTNRKISTKLL